MDNKEQPPILSAYLAMCPATKPRTPELCVGLAPCEVRYLEHSMAILFSSNTIHPWIISYRSITLVATGSLSVRVLNLQPDARCHIQTSARHNAFTFVNLMPPAPPALDYNGAYYVGSVLETFFNSSSSRWNYKG